MLEQILKEAEERFNKGKSFTNKFDLSENIFIYETIPNLGYKREQLPQIEKEDIDSLILHFKGVADVKKIKIPVNRLKPTQCELNKKKIDNKLKKHSNQWRKRTYIISKEYRLLDGHHDFAQALEEDPNYEVVCYKITLPIKELIRRVKIMKISKIKDLSDKLIESVIKLV